MKDNCDQCNKEVYSMQWTAANEGGYFIFCSKKCGVKYIKENAEIFVCNSQSVWEDEDGN